MRIRRTALIALAVVGGVAILPISFRLQSHAGPAPPDMSAPEWQLRTDALARAQVVNDRNQTVDAAALTGGPDDNVGEDTPIDCEYVPKATTGTSPKFQCRLPSGEIVKVKYDSLEVFAEIAATRLVTALGFGADTMSSVRRLRCHGCPPSPYNTRRFYEHFYAGALADRLYDPARTVEFEWVAIERKYPGRSFEYADVTGWTFDELSAVKVERGGASRAELDALRLVAVVLGHWDNKSENHRLVCREDTEHDASAAPCGQPLLLMHDLGSTFGNSRVDLASWRQQRIWVDETACRVGIPRARAPALPVEISEAGRLWLASRLARLTSAQIEAWFRGARFPGPENRNAPASDVAPWVRAFEEKVRAIAGHAPCAATQ